jgi:hypothetical protein
VSYRNLEIWKLARELAVDIHNELCSKGCLSFPLVGNLSERLFGQRPIGKRGKREISWIINLQKIPLALPLIEGMLQRRIPDKPE